MSAATPLAAEPAAPSGLRPRRRSWRELPAVWSAPYLAPAVVLYAVFLIYPMLDSVRLAFHSWTGYATDEQTFVGLDNFVRLFTEDTQKS